jgi:hypothetical protein
MKTLILIMLLTGCTTSIKSPVTQFEYTGYIRQEGIGVTVKPPLWEGAVSLYKSFTEEDKKDTQDD